MPRNKANFVKRNVRPTESRTFLDLPFLLKDSGLDPDERENQKRLLALMKFEFAASCYIEYGKFDAERTPGPVMKNQKGKNKNFFGNFPEGPGRYTARAFLLYGQNIYLFDFITNNSYLQTFCA